MNKRIAVIIGGGPAGLTTAYELIKRSDIKPIVIEKEALLGGLSKTVNYKGNRMDIGGHRFFSKSDVVMKWWEDFLPQESEMISADKTDNVMLVRNRISRIYFLRKFFSYPISLSLKTIKGLGFVRLIRIGFSYIFIRLFPIKNEKSLEDFYVNRFGRELYNTFFKDYTEKVWGTSCSNISKEWGAQRVKGLSISKAIIHALKQPFIHYKTVSQKTTETSLIERFLYPKFGPGQLWELVGQKVEVGGGEILREKRVVGWVYSDKGFLTGVKVLDISGEESTIMADYIISTMPIKDLVFSMGDKVSKVVSEIANGLVYRDFMTVGLLLDKMNVPKQLNERLYPDTWIYIQERDVKIGRVQLFNNWSPYMVNNQDTVWLGLEYFVDEGDELWSMLDDQFIKMAIDEMVSIGMINKEAVMDATLLRVEKAYPAYFGTYNKIDEVITYLDQYKNLFLIGRNGMHKYNNQDHSMLTAMAAVEAIITGNTDKSSIWGVNTEQEYHEETKTINN